MKKRLMIFCSLISLLLVGFQFPIYAEEDPSDTPSSVPVPNSIRLDQYFFDNYDLLPYIESDGNQYIDTGITVNSDLKIEGTFSLKNVSDGAFRYIFGGRNALHDSAIGISYNSFNDIFYFDVSEYTISSSHNLNFLERIVFDKNYVYFNGNLIHEFVYDEFSSNYSLYIFSNNNGGVNHTMSSGRLYNFSIYDYDSESYVRYYYPAKSKAGGIIGLYDAVSDTFVTTSGSVPFASPVNDQVLNFQIGTFLTAGLGWIGDILEFAVETPIIMIFMAIGLAGAMFRWGRRLVHF